MRALPLNLKITLRGCLRTRGHATPPAISTADLLDFSARAMGPRRRFWLRGTNRDNGAPLTRIESHPWMRGCWHAPTVSRTTA